MASAEVEMSDSRSHAAASPAASATRTGDAAVGVAKGVKSYYQSKVRRGSWAAEARGLWLLGTRRRPAAGARANAPTNVVARRLPLLPHPPRPQLDELEAIIRDKQQNLRRLEAQRNALNSKGAWRRGALAAGRANALC
jgi:hypothetical protein